MILRGVILLITILLVSSTLAFAQTHFADVTFRVNDAGDSQISAITNVADYNVASSNAFTSKNKNLWLFNLSDTRVYENIYFEVVLPKDAQIQYMKSSLPARIIVVDGHPAVRGVAQNSTFDVMIQYEIIPAANSSSVWLYIISFICIAMGVSLFFRPKTKKGDTKTLYASKLTKSTQSLVERQAQIVSLLKQKGKLTQVQLAKELNLPKSSVFRQIKSLQQKGIVVKEHMGMSTIISLKKE